MVFSYPEELCTAPVILRRIMERSNNKYIVLVSLLILYAVMASVIVTPGMLVGHDTMFHVLRIENLADSIRHGNYFPQMFPNMNDGYGYGIPLFYSNTFLYLPAVLNALGLNIVLCYKIFVLTILAFAEVICFYSMKKVTANRYTALIITLFYLGSAYFAIDVYVRGAIGEALAYMFYPLIVLGIYRNVFDEYKNNWPLVVGFSCVALSHNLSLIMFAMIYVLLIVVNCKRFIREPKRILSLMLNAVTAVCISAFFLLPMAEQFLNASFFSDYAIREFNPGTAAVRLSNLFVTVAPTGYDYVPSLGVTMFVCLMAMALGIKAKTTLTPFRISSVLIGFAALFLTTGHFPYAALDPMFNFIQFPWRWFVIVTMYFAVAAGISLTEYAERKSIKRSNLWIVVILLMTCIQFEAIAIPDYIKARNTDPEHAYNTYIVNSTEKFTNVDEMYLNGNNIRKEWRSRDGLPHSSNEKKIELSGTREYDRYDIVFSSGSAEEELIEFPIVYYYGQTASDSEGSRYEVHPSWRGYSEVGISGLQSGTISLTYKTTFIQKASAVFSGIAIAVLIVYEIKQKQRKKPNE